MIPLQKVKDIIERHNVLEKELSSSNIDPKLFAKKSKEYSNLGSIITVAKEYISFEIEKSDLEQILKDKNNDTEMQEMAKKDLDEMEQKKRNMRMSSKYFYYLKMRMTIKMQLLKSEQEQEDWKPHYFVQICLKCMKRYVQKKNGYLNL